MFTDWLLPIFETENAFWSLAASKAFVVVHTLQLSVA